MKYKNVLLVGAVLIGLMFAQAGFVTFGASAEATNGDSIPPVTENDCKAIGKKFDSASEACYDSQSTILPFTEHDVKNCKKAFHYEAQTGGFKELFKDKKAGGTIEIDPPDGGTFSKLDFLACGIKTGRMKLWMMPFYIKYLLQFVLSIAGLIAVGAMVFGGYLYMFGALMDEKEKGKKTIVNGIMGFVVVLLSWAIVNVVISLVTM